MCRLKKKASGLCSLRLFGTQKKSSHNDLLPEYIMSCHFFVGLQLRVGGDIFDDNETWTFLVFLLADLKESQRERLVTTYHHKFSLVIIPRKFRIKQGSGFFLIGWDWCIYTCMGWFSYGCCWFQLLFQFCLGQTPRFHWWPPNTRNHPSDWCTSATKKNLGYTFHWNPYCLIGIPIWLGSVSSPTSTLSTRLGPFYSLLTYLQLILQRAQGWKAVSHP